MPGAHEFAVKPPPRRKSTVSTTLSGDDSAALTATSSTANDGDALSNTPTQPYRLSRILQGPTLDTSSEPSSSSSPTILNSPSLTSSRPAPLSPAPSRRVSTMSARSSKSGTISTPLSRNSSRRQSRNSAGFSKRLSALSTSGSTTTTLALTRKDDHDAADKPTVTPTVSASSMILLQSTSTASSSSSSSSTSTTTATTLPTSQPSSSPPTTTTTTKSPTTSLQNPPSSSSTASHPPNPHRRPTSTKIKIRDFAYTSSDNRYRGLGSDVPKPNQFSRLNKKLGGPKKARPTSERWSLCSRSSSDVDDGDEVKKKKKKKKSGRGTAVRNNNGWDESDNDDDDDDDSSDEEEEEEYEEEGWFKKGMGRFSWSFGFSGFRKQIQDPTTPTPNNTTSYPSRGEMDMNFSTTIEDETPSSESSESYHGAPEDDKGEADEALEAGVDEVEEEEEEEEPLYPGLYRALYPFEPEGTAEMRLVEDQVVRVVGRGGGVGWAVVVVPDGVDGGVVVVETGAVGVEKEIRHALVPESYLELVQLD